MTASGQSRPFGDFCSMSGLPDSGLKSDIVTRRLSADFVAEVAEERSRLRLAAS
jgi:hypothetical protein